MPFGMSGSIMQGGVGSGRSSEPAVAPVVNFSDPVPTSGVAGTVVIDWTISYTGTVTSADISSGSTTTNNIGKVWHSSTTSGAAQGTWSLINPTATDGTAKVRFTSSDGSGGFVRVLMLANAAYNGALGSAQTAWNTPNASVTATPPLVTISAPSATSVAHDDTVTWTVTYSSFATSYGLTTGLLNVTGSPGVWFVYPLTWNTSSATVSFTPTSGNTATYFSVQSGAAYNGTVANIASANSASVAVTGK